MDKLFHRIARMPLLVKLAVFAVSIGIVFAVFFFAFLGGVSARDGIEAARRARDQAKQSYETAQADKEKEREACRSQKEKLKRTKNQMKDMQNKLPDNPSISELIRELKSKLGEVLLVEYSRLPEEVGRVSATIPLKLSVRGPFHGILKFFHEVSRMSRIVNVRDLVLTQPRIVANKTVLTATFRVETFRYISRKRRRQLLKKQRGGTRGKKKGAR